MNREEHAYCYRRGFLRAGLPSTTPDRTAKFTTEGESARATEASRVARRKGVKKFANACQHFLWQNAAFMRRALFF